MGAPHTKATREQALSLVRSGVSAYKASEQLAKRGIRIDGKTIAGWCKSEGVQLPPKPLPIPQFQAHGPKNWSQATRDRWDAFWGRDRHIQDVIDEHSTDLPVVGAAEFFGDRKREERQVAGQPKKVLLQKWPQETRDEALRRVQAGQHPKEVAASMGISHKTIETWCVRHKIEYKHRAGGPRSNFVPGPPQQADPAPVVAECQESPENATTSLPEATASILEERIARIIPTDQIEAAVEHLSGVTRGQWRRLPEDVRSAIEALERYAEERRSA